MVSGWSQLGHRLSVTIFLFWRLDFVDRDLFWSLSLNLCSNMNRESKKFSLGNVLASLKVKSKWISGILGCLSFRYWLFSKAILFWYSCLMNLYGYC